MLTIYRYSLPKIHKKESRFEMSIQGPGDILWVDEQKGLDHQDEYVSSMHVLVETREPARVRRFRIYGKGDSLDDMNEEAWTHVASWKSASGYTWHLFEIFS